LSNFKPDYYDLVILDIMMPKMDGFELYEKIKEKDDKVKICFLTASELYYEEPIFKKTIDNDDLLKEVNKIMKLC
jgi:CheY-like chemotaxis protein